MKTKTKPKKCFFHRWREVGWDGLATLIDECEKRHWQRAFTSWSGGAGMHVCSELLLCDRCANNHANKETKETLMSDPMTPERLAEIEARANAATEGPWETERYWGAVTRGPDSIIHSYYDGECPACGASIEESATDVVTVEDAAFIAAARTDVPALLAEVRRLQATVANWERWADSLPPRWQRCYCGNCEP